MAAPVPLSDCASTPSIYCVVNEIKPAGSTALFLTYSFFSHISHFLKKNNAIRKNDVEFMWLCDYIKAALNAGYSIYFTSKYNLVDTGASICCHNATIHSEVTIMKQ